VGDVLSAEMKGIPGKATLYEVRAIGAPYNIRLKTRRNALVRLAAPMKIEIHRIREKVLIGSNLEVQLTHLSETGAQVVLAGELVQWEDVRLHLFEPDGTPVPGKVYGKVTQVQPGAGGSLTATIRFTSPPPEIYRIIQPKDDNKSS